VRYRVYDIFIVSASVTCASACIIGEEGREKERERERKREKERQRERERERERDRERERRRREIPAENHISGHLFLANIQLRQSIMYNCTR